MALVGGKIWHRKGADSRHGELWLVSYADMMTLLFGFFVILYSFSQVDDDRFAQVAKEMVDTFGGKPQAHQVDRDTGTLSENRKIRALQMLIAILNLGDSMDEGVAKIEQAVARSKAETGGLAAAKTQIEAAAHGDLASLKPGIVEKERTIQIVLPADILFPSGSNRLSTRAQAQITALGAQLSLVDGVIGIDVVGHTDSRPSSNPLTSAYALSSARAASVAERLIAGGAAAKAVRAVGVGASDPLLPEYRADQTPILENMAKNRRVEIIIRKKARHDGQAH